MFTSMTTINRTHR